MEQLDRQMEEDCNKFINFKKGDLIILLSLLDDDFSVLKEIILKKLNDL